MKKERRKLCLLLFGVILLTGCHMVKGVRTDRIEPQEYARASLFCDVNFWEPPSWDTAEGTITGEISKKTGLALDINVPVQNAGMQLKIMLLNDRLPDIITLTDTTVISQLVSSEKVWKLEEFLKEYCPDSEILRNFPQDIKEKLIERDGDWYAYPSHMNSLDARRIWKPSSKFYEEWKLYNDNNGIIWNRALMEQAGITLEELETEEQVMAAWEKASRMETLDSKEKVIPLLVDGKDYIDPTVKFLLYTFGAEYTDQDGAYRDIILSPQAERALLFLNEAMRAGYTYPEQLTYENEKIKRILAQGNVLCFIGNVANSGITFTEWVSSGPILSSHGDSPALGRNLEATTGWMNTFISKECENPEKVAVWLDYMCSEEGHMRWQLGAEGVDYITTDGGLKKRTEAGRQKMADYSQTGIGTWWMFMNTAWERSIYAEPDEGSEEWAEQKIHTAFGRSSHTKCYDIALLPLETQSIPLERTDIRALDIRIKAYKNRQILRIILAESRQEAASLYQEMVSSLDSMGLRRLDNFKNQLYLENCRKYGENSGKARSDK